jgi:site-specific DNA-methyltransferase (adenine-specific)
MSSRRNQKLPVVIKAAIETMTEAMAKLDANAKRDRSHYHKIGAAWYAIKASPELDEIGGIGALRPHLPNTPEWLNRCAIAYDGHRTGDLQKAELWAKHNYRHPRNLYEPYRMAELVEAYRNRRKLPAVRRSLTVMTQANRLDGNPRVSFGSHGSAILGDCHKLLAEVPDAVIDAVIVDPPFGSLGTHWKTVNEWDKPLDWDVVWPELLRVLKPFGNIAICSMEPLTSALVQAQVQHYLFKEFWVRKATNIIGPYHNRPLNLVEEIPVFSRGRKNQRTFNPQMIPIEPYSKLLPKLGEVYRYKTLKDSRNRQQYSTKYPGNLIAVPRSDHDKPHFMQCQKPVELLRRLVRTYTNADDVVLDFCAGSFTTGVACFLEGRKFIGLEQERRHFAFGTRRLQALIAQAAPEPKAATEIPTPELV